MGSTPGQNPTPPHGGRKRVYFRPPSNYYSMTEQEQLAWCEEVLAPLFDEPGPSDSDRD